MIYCQNTALVLKYPLATKWFKVAPNIKWLNMAECSHLRNKYFAQHNATWRQVVDSGVKGNIFFAPQCATFPTFSTSFVVEFDEKWRKVLLKNKFLAPHCDTFRRKIIFKNW